ncbi:3-hydroxyisobutyrate dehydrogenase, mitochondrial isoform X2 [Bacillus rossius redtenbacheri]
MGSPMAANLLNKGHQLAVYDVVPEAAARLAAAGAEACAGAGEVAARSGRVITMLPSDASVLHTYLAEGGILQSVKQGTLLVDCSTVDASTAKTVSAAAADKGAVFYDAPVSGGVGAATSGQLTFIVGGSSTHFPAVRQLLGPMGSKVLLCGPVGSGQAAKMCNNMLLAVSMLGTAEAMNLGIRLGLEPKVLMDVINSCSGRCWSSEVYNPVPGTLPNVPSANHYKGGFTTRLMAKDLSIAQNAATSCHAPISLGALAHQIYRIMVTNGFGDKDFSSVFELLSEKKKFM